MSSYRDSRDTPIGTDAPTGHYHLSGHTYVIGVPRGGGGPQSCNAGRLSRKVGPKARRKASKPEPWPPPELSLPNLSTLEALSRGQPEPEPDGDVGTEARCLWPMASMTEATG